MSKTLVVQNGLQLSAIVEVVKCSGDEIAGNDISSNVMEHHFETDSIISLIAARIKVKLGQCIGGL